MTMQIGQLYPNPPLPENPVVSQTAEIVGSTRIVNMVSISQADYDNIVSPDPQTLYVIVP